MSHKIARNSLDFAGTASMCGGQETPPMDLPPETIETTLKVYLSQMRVRLDEAASIAKAAETCADAGNVARASRSRSTSSNCSMR
ncbi:MAG: hypothetical protein AB7V46_19325 [Thermomicrobiales bacterium]